MDLLIALFALICAIAALALIRRQNVQAQRLSNAVDVVSQTASRARVASDAAAATLARDQDALWRMRSDVDAARRDIEGVHAEIEAVRQEIEIVRRDIETGRNEIEAVRKEIESVRRVIGSLRLDLNDVRKSIEGGRAAVDPAPLPIPPRSQRETVDALREKLKAEQQTADPDEDDR